MDRSYLNRWASWVARWLVASLVVTAGACSWWSTADRSGPMSAFRTCAETSMWDSAPLPEPRRGRQEVRCATLTVLVDYADPGRGSLDLAVIRVRAADQHDRIGSLVLNPGGPGLSGLDYMPLWDSWLSEATPQIAGFEAAFAAYADRCSQRESCVPFGDPRALFDRVVRTARSTPIPSGQPVGDPPANAETVLGFVTSPEAWPSLDTAPREAHDGDSGSLYGMIDSLEGKTPERRDVDVDDGAFAIGCNDGAGGPPAAQLRAEAARPAITYPRFSEYGSWWLFRCTLWMMPHPVLPTPETITASPVLVIATEADPATPYYGGVALARALGPSANLLTVSGGRRTAFERSPCLAGHVTLYLVELRVPGGHAC